MVTEAVRLSQALKAPQRWNALIQRVLRGPSFALEGNYAHSGCT